MQAAAPQPPPLLQLPHELLRNIWHALEDSATQPATHQHALRCVCKAIRDASNAWISSMRFDAGCVLREHLQGETLFNVSLTMARSQLSRFPQAAVLQSLAWTSIPTCMLDEQSALRQLRDLLCAFLFHAPPDRLSSIRSVTLFCRDLSCADIGSLVDTCPALQELKIDDACVSGPVFAPLKRLHSFRSLRLSDISTSPEHRALVLSTLSSLTALTKLEVIGNEADYIQHVPGGACLTSTAILPCVAAFSQLRHLQCLISDGNDEEEDAYTTGDAVAQHISGLQHLTSLEVSHCQFPFPYPTLACASSLASLSLIGSLDTPLVRMFAAMPRLSRVEVSRLEPGTDFSQLRCNWEEVRLLRSISPHQVLWLPCSIKRLTISGGLRLELVEGDSLDSVRRLLTETEQLLAEKPGWDRWVRLGLWAVATAPPLSLALLPASSGAHGVRAMASQPPQPPASAPSSSAVCQAIAAVAQVSPLRQRLSILHLGSGCRLDAAVALQGAQLLPDIRLLSVDATCPGFESFLAGLGQTAWLQELSLSSGDSNDGPSHQAYEQTVEALRQLAVARGSAGHSLETGVREWLADVQLDYMDAITVLNQAATQHSRPGCRVTFG